MSCGTSNVLTEEHEEIFVPERGKQTVQADRVGKVHEQLRFSRDRCIPSCIVICIIQTGAICHYILFNIV